MTLNNQEVKLVNELVEPFVEKKQLGGWPPLNMSVGLITRGVVITMIDDTGNLRRIRGFDAN